MRQNTVFLHFRHLSFSKLLSCRLSLARQFKDKQRKSRKRIWMLKRRKSVTGARSMVTRAKVICGSNAGDSKKSQQKGRNKRKRIRRIKREKEKPTNRPT